MLCARRMAYVTAREGWSSELRNVSSELRNLSSELRNLSSDLRNLSLDLRNLSSELRNLSLDWKVPGVPVRKSISTERQFPLRFCVLKYPWWLQRVAERGGRPGAPGAAPVRTEKCQFDTEN